MKEVHGLILNQLNGLTVEWFENYARVLFENYGSKVKYWLTINEQNMLTLVGPLIGTLHIPEGCENVVKETYQQNHHMLVAQAKAMALLHKMFPEDKIGRQDWSCSQYLACLSSKL